VIVRRKAAGDVHHEDPMATDPNMDLKWYEKLGDALSGFSDAVGRWLMALFGSSNERYIREMGYLRSKTPGITHNAKPGSLLEQVNSLEEKMRALTDEQLRDLTPPLKQRLANGATLEDILPEAFAACREAGRRTKNMRHFDSQILGGIVLHRGNIAEMVTGEGKTLVATLPAYLNALTGKGVHIITVNDYLARRDCEWMTPIYKALGVTAGFIQSDMDAPARHKAYDCDITYGTNSEFGFDHLRDNMKPARWGDPDFDPWYHQCQRALNYAIIDEVDNILIDEARTPLIISGQAFTDVRRYGQANDIAVKLTDLQKSQPGRYFEVKEKEHTCHLTDEGIRKAEELAGVESFYTAGNMEWPHLIDNALRAHHLYKKDKQYAVMNDEETREKIVIIIDEFTGRLMHGRQWSDGLHQAVEAKHARDGVRIKEETQTLATITLQNFFRMYKKLAGMTGTAMTEANEFWKIYKLEVIAIPTNKALIRKNSSDLIYRTGKEKWKACVDEIAEVHEGGRPILIGTTDVDKSIKLSDMLKRRGIKHELLNALPEHAAREAEIVAQAGRIGSVTIATNMAGRGTDIILGGNPETLAWARLKDKYATRLDVPEDLWKKTVEDIEQKEKMKEEGRKVAEMGGLHIVGTERHESRRIDNQLRGRAGRQGDPGSSRFYLSLEDDLMRIFAGEWVSNLLGRLGMEEGQAIESRMVSRRIEGAQKKIEERNFESRKSLLDFDEVMDTQRKRVYGYRQEVLEGANPKTRILKMIQDEVNAALKRFLDMNYGAATFAEFASSRLGIEFSASDFSRADFEEAERTAKDRATRDVETKVQEMLEENLGAEDSKEWNWQNLAHQIGARWGLKYNDRQLRQIGKDNLSEKLQAEGEQAVGEVDLSEGKPYLEKDWGLKSLCDWVRLKFQVPITLEEVSDRSEAELRTPVMGKIHALYRQKDIDFPVTAAMARFMAERAQATPGGQRYNREGLFQWAQMRFPAMKDRINEDDFRTQPRSKIQEILRGISAAAFPAKDQTLIDTKIDEEFANTKLSETEDGKSLAAWAKAELGLDVPEAALTKVTLDKARDVLWNAYDRACRPEMHSMERSLLIAQLDSSWKNHLLTMDHLRSAMNLVWVGQIDPKTEYKKQGMKEFKTMWEGIASRVAENVFRMEETEGLHESIWVINSATQERAQSAVTAAAAQAQQGVANGQTDKKVEPIRNRGEKVGRNDPCPCGSGKKYKNCHMRSAKV
jgi:preprotein translocase subunit SecA